MWPTQLPRYSRYIFTYISRVLAFCDHKSPVAESCFQVGENHFSFNIKVIWIWASCRLVEINASEEVAVYFYTFSCTFLTKIWKIVLITVQRDATQSSLFIILHVHSTCFGCQPHPSSGIHKPVTTACGTGHIFCAATLATLALQGRWLHEKYDQYRRL